MTDDDFVRAIMAQPEADEPRARWADALVARGDPRGEFVRVQLRLAELYRAHGDRREIARLTRRQREILTEHEAEWTHALADVLPRGARAIFVRGLVEGLETSASDWLARSAALTARAPIVMLDLKSVNVESLAAVVASPAFERIGALSIFDQPLGDAGVGLLADAPSSSNLRYLDLRKDGIGRDGMEALVASPHLRGLCFVDLALNAVESPVDHAATDNGTVIHYVTPALGRELEQKHGPRSWLHRRTGDAFWDQPPWPTFTG